MFAARRRGVIPGDPLSAHFANDQYGLEPAFSFIRAPQDDGAGLKQVPGTGRGDFDEWCFGSGSQRRLRLVFVGHTILLRWCVGELPAGCKIANRAQPIWTMLIFEWLAA